MTQIRQDALSGHWVILSENRASRPIAVKAGHIENQSGWLCPFCEGNESTTPPEVEALRPAASQPNTPGWRLRTVPNKFGALSTETPVGELHRGVFDELAGFGHHEVVVESPQHRASIADFSVDKLTELLSAYRSRLKALYADEGVRYVQVFRNEGYLAGASLEHPHSQILALPLVPPFIRNMVDRSLSPPKGVKGCLTCALIEQETREKERVILDRDDFLAVAPYASRLPGEIAIFPRTHAHRFEQAPDAVLARLAEVLRRVIWTVMKHFDSPPFNLLLITSPRGDREAFTEKQLQKAFHWHFQLLPRTTRPAGLEWGTGLHLNTLPPETAARLLRETLGKGRIPAGSVKR